MGKRKYTTYLKEQMRYYKKKAKETNNEIKKIRCQQLYDMFKDKLYNYKEKNKWVTQN